jgi:hypothetical protein
MNQDAEDRLLRTHAPLHFVPEGVIAKDRPDAVALTHQVRICP